MPSNKFYSSLHPVKTLTTSSFAPPELNGSGGTHGEQVQINYFPDDPRPKPKGLDLFRWGTGMAVNKVSERNPRISRTIISGDDWINYESTASTAVNAAALNWPDDGPLVSSQVQARNAFLVALKNEKLNIGTIAIQYKLTARTVTDFARAVSNTLAQPQMTLALKFLRTYGTRRSNRRRWTPSQWSAYAKLRSNERTKDAIGGYFSYIYGLKPTMSEITASVFGLQDLYSSEREQFRTLTVRRTSGDMKSLRADPASDAFYGRGGVVHGAATASTYIKAIYRVSTPLKTASEFGISNPASAIYNAIPYSFVLDWIFPVGVYLSTLDASLGIEDLLWIENSVYSRSMRASSGHALNYESKYRSMPSTGVPSFTLRYQPSSFITNMMNGLFLLKQRY